VDAHDGQLNCLVPFGIQCAVDGRSRLFGITEGEDEVLKAGVSSERQRRDFSSRGTYWIACSTTVLCSQIAALYFRSGSFPSPWTCQLNGSDVPQ
jgi:hypothetical protein